MRFQKKVKLAYLKERYEKIEKSICWSIDLFTHTTTDVLVSSVIGEVPTASRRDVLAVAEELRAELEIFYDAKGDYWCLTPCNL